ncbi:MAG: bifunctional ADP-dependent NAD(P)H-hydrate dehydratase/NAD(P)H-hydrate epimerase, partial [Clostridia bacterium]|nr:bifunctional ADP-dependent NAD(P)H-hydrate dehydratase/NAD(P)H-hydrate epimerase [Clostridia bacterium]
MKTVLSSDIMKLSDAEACAAVGSKELMLRAGRAMVKAAMDEGYMRPGDRAAVVCGAGNNAGDGYVIAEELVLRENIAVDIYRTSEKFSEDGLYYYNRATAAGATDAYGIGAGGARELPAGYAVVFDCIYGMGYKGRVSGAAAAAIAAINAARGRRLPDEDPQENRVTRVVSADLNSGLCADSGLGGICVISDLTVAVQAFKPGHFLGRAKDVIGKKIAADIGIASVGEEYHLVEKEDLVGVIPERDNYSHKGKYGYDALIGGSVACSGAVRLAAMANAAMRSGAGVVRVGAPASVCPLIIPQILESTLFPLPDKDGNIEFSSDAVDKLASGMKSITFGMGVGTGDGARKTLLRLLNYYTGRLVIDADGLNILANELKDDPRLLDSSSCENIIITPHLGEFSRLTGKPVSEIENNPIAEAAEFAYAHGVTVLLKGPTTVVVGSRGIELLSGSRTDNGFDEVGLIAEAHEPKTGLEIYLIDAGCAGMATAGSGDVLSGVLAALFGYIGDPIVTACAAAWIAGRAGERAEKKYGSVSMIASDT